MNVFVGQWNLTYTGLLWLYRSTQNLPKLMLSAPINVSHHFYGLVLVPYGVRIIEAPLQCIPDPVIQ